MKTKHTMGPWQIQQYKNFIGFSVWAAGAGCIAERWYDSEQQPPYGDEMKANAHLIAGAPEMLAALTMNAERMESAIEALDQAQPGMPHLPKVWKDWFERHAHAVARCARQGITKATEQP